MATSLLLAGFVGGIVRGLVGYVKYFTSYKNVKFDWVYFLIIVGISGAVGLTCGWLVSGIVDKAVMNGFYAFIAGYAGGDFIENVYKIILKKPSLFPIPNNFIKIK